MGDIDEDILEDSLQGKHITSHAKVLMFPTLDQYFAIETN